MASGGYPGNYSNNHPILGLEDISSKYGHKVFHGGTKFANNRLVTNGGRVLCVTALGDSLEDAKTSAYELVSKISWENVQYRTDIGWRANRKKQKKKLTCLTCLLFLIFSIPFEPFGTSHFAAVIIFLIVLMLTFSITPKLSKSTNLKLTEISSIF